MTHPPLPSTKLLALGLLGAVLLAGCATSRATTGESLGPGYTLYPGEWKGGSVTTLALRAREDGGKVSFCGAYATVPGRDGLELHIDSYVANLLRGARVGLGGTWMLLDLSFLADHGADARFSGRPASCVVTEIPWRARYASTPLDFMAPGFFGRPAD
ncbi:hypothetical protein [Neomegalonema sp.]|uniref:hypothetical protein n=1 Tax=Neomegalonema sp. TaxID=2039713 RepID=UPI00261CDB18|nr:hypothetical protein [Neomegalonema sp.]MDD2867209.1 hypothetical protein [Neomegalonema sp.]